jgi:Xaa-Pro aminopeptidase
MRQMERGVAVLRNPPATPGARRYQPDPHFYYLTGLAEPDAVGVLAPEHPQHTFVLFVRPKEWKEELWTGRRLGVEGAQEELGADAAFPIKELDEKIGPYLETAERLYYPCGAEEAFDRKVWDWLKHYGRERAGGGRGPGMLADARVILQEMRLFKDEVELAAMRRAGAVSAAGHRAAQSAARPGCYEYEVEAAIEAAFRQAGADGLAFNTIVASGANATILHYEANNRLIGERDLVLIDAAAACDHYAADITRTFPASGAFTAPQRALYDVVLAAFHAAAERLRPGYPFAAVHQAALRTIVAGLVDLGWLEGDVDTLIAEKKQEPFYMHGTCHGVGLHVHDPGPGRLNEESRPLEPGLAFTVEPGLYVATHQEDVPEEFRGIGIRIEDTVVITPDGYENLTAEAAKEGTEMETGKLGN